MTIKLPKSGGKFLEAITACGVVEAKLVEKSLRKELEKSERKEVRLYAPLKGGGRVGVVVSGDDNDRGVHFHLDIFSRSFLKTSKRRTRARNRLDEVEDVFKAFLGKPIDVAATGKFSVPLSEINEDSVTQLLLKVSVGPNGLGRLAGAFYEIEAESEPISVVHWTKSDDQLKVVVESVSSSVIDSDYLERLAAPLESALRTMVLE